MNLSDQKFIYEAFKLYKSNKYCLEFLKDNPFIMDRFKELVSKNKVTGSNLNRANFFINLYDSYVFLSNTLDIVNNPNDYTDFDRIEFFKDFKSFDGKRRALSVFSTEERKLLERIYFNCDTCKGKVLRYDYVDQIKGKYDKIVSVYKKLLRCYNKYGNNKLYSLMYDDMKLNQHVFCKIESYISSLYFKRLFLGVNDIEKDILKDFSFEEILLLDSISDKYSVLFNDFKTHNGNLYCTDVSQYEKLFDLFDKINGFMKDNSLEYCVCYLSNDLKILLNELETEYNPIFRSYCSLKLFNNNEELNNLIKRELKYYDAINFYDVMCFYRKLILNCDSVIDLVCSDRDDIEVLINMIYDAKYFNGVVPSINQDILLPKVRAIKDDSKRKKCMNFINGYKNYYFIKKKEMDDLRKQEEFENEIRGLDSYASCIRLYLNSGCESLSDFYLKGEVDKNVFENALLILKKHNHPVYEEYSEYVSNIKSRNYAIMLAGVKRVTDLIKSGILLSDGTKREFNIIDYYFNTDLDKQKFLELLKKNSSNADYVIVSRFFAKYKNDMEISNNGINQLFDTKLSFSCEFDSNGNVVSSYTVTNEDKQSAILKLREMGVPLTVSTYNIMLRSIVDDIINGLNNQNNLTK